ncbi:MAG: hypothetical protein FWF01_04765 [Alphaproteobacteria bacterium]|nr:hypothetical protein [Alphaproteobacteria bacterium]
MRLLLAVIAVLLVAGCGARPIRSDNPYGIRIAPISTQDGVEMRRVLTDVLGPPPQQAKYVLHVSLRRHPPVDQAIGLDDLPTRQRLGLSASYVIRDNEGNEVASGTRTATASYNLMPSPYASQIAAQNTYTRLARSLASEIAVLVRVFFENGEN